MEICVKTLTGRSARVVARDGDTVKVVKSKAEAAIGTALGMQHRLYHRGAAVKDSLPISSLNLANGEFLTLIGLVSRKNLINVAQPAHTTVPGSSGLTGPEETSHSEPALGTASQRGAPFGPLQTGVSKPPVIQQSATPSIPSAPAGQSAGAPPGSAANAEPQPSGFRSVDVEVIEASPDVDVVRGGQTVGPLRSTVEPPHKGATDIQGGHIGGILNRRSEEATPGSASQIIELEEGERNRFAEGGKNMHPGIPINVAILSEQQPGTSRAQGGGTELGDKPPAELRAVQIEGSQAGATRQPARKKLVDSINALSQKKLPEGARKKLDEGALDWAETGVSEPSDGEGTARIMRQGADGGGTDCWQEPGEEETEGVQSMYGREQARVRAKRDGRRGPGEMPGSIVGGLLEAAAAIQSGKRGSSEGPERGVGLEGSPRGRRRRGVGRDGRKRGVSRDGEGGEHVGGQLRRRRVEEWSDDDDDVAEVTEEGESVEKEGEENAAGRGGRRRSTQPSDRRGHDGEIDAEEGDKSERDGGGERESPGAEDGNGGSPVEKRGRRAVGRRERDAVGETESGNRRKRLRKVGRKSVPDRQANGEVSGAATADGQSEEGGTQEKPSEGLRGAEDKPGDANEGLDPALKEPSRARKRRKLGVSFQDGSVVLDIRTNSGDAALADVSIGDEEVSARPDDENGDGSTRRRPPRKRKGPVVDLSDEDQGEGQAAEKPRAAKRGPSTSGGKKAQAFDHLALPPELARVERVFNALNVVYSFLQRQHVQSTWQNVRRAMRQTLKDEGAMLTSADVESLQALCPQVVLLRNFVGFRPQRGLTPGETSTAGAGTETGVGVNRGGMEESHRDKPEEENVVKLETDEDDMDEMWVAGATSEAGKAEDPDGDYSFTIDIVDPLRGPGSLQRVPVISPDDGTDFVSGGFKPVPQLRKQSDKEVTNLIERRRRAFKSRIVELVGRLHQTWAADQPDASDEEDSPAGFDPWKKGTWHPDFPLADVALPELLEAAKQVDADVSKAPSDARKRRGLGFRRGYVPIISNLEQTERGDPDVAVLLEDLSRVYGINLGGRTAGSPDPPGPDSPPEGGESGGEEIPKDIPRPPKQLKKVPRCESTQNFDSVEMLEHLKGGLGSLGQVVHTEMITVRQPQFLAPSVQFSEGVRKVLETKGLIAGQLFTHQARAINAAINGRHVVVATSTASGKSLCYNLPVLEAVLAGHQASAGVENQYPEFETQASGPACALYLFPTKALAQDQMRALGELTATLEMRPRVCVYDGDTPFGERPEMRENADVLITNPDMLHVAMLPAHKQFRRILTNLRYVVVDEAHAYGGVFGCHTALILRRLRRVCAQVYGSHPTFVVCSATVANPKEHAQELIGIDDWEVVTEDGSPRGEKMFVMWNPPLTSSPAGKGKGKIKEYVALVRQGRVMPVAEQSYAERMKKKAIEEGTNENEFRRSSPIVEVALLLAEFIQHGLRCLAFCKTRKLCELVLTYTRETLKVTAPHLIHTLKSYRAGYTPADRRQIEADLFAGRLRGVCATNALELGVDVGSLDATLHLGYPGSQASLWQQSGRAGRRISDRGSLSVYVAFGGPLDQYFMRDPQRLFGRPIENAQVDSRNWKCLLQHLACAAVENPLQFGVDDHYFGASMADAIKELSSQGRLGRNSRAPGGAAGALHYIGLEKSPSKGMSLRAIDPEKYAVVNEATNEIIEEVEASKAFFEVYEGSIYMHQGKTYRIEDLDLETKIARCKETTVRYYTKTRDMTEVHVIGGNLAYPGKAPDPARYPFTTAKCGRANVSLTFLGFVKIWRGTGEVFDMVDLFLPPVKYTTQAAWVRVPHEVRLEVGEGFREGLHAAGHAILNVLPLYVMCSPNDIGCECASPDDTRFRPERLLVYDKQPDGIGIAVQARPMFAELLQAALELLEACECTLSDGCPGCVHHTGCGEYNRCLDKRYAIAILKSVIAAEAVRKEQGTYEADTGEEAGFFEDATRGDPSASTANEDQPRAKGPEVVYGRDQTWDETLKSIEELFPLEGGL